MVPGANGWHHDDENDDRRDVEQAERGRHLYEEVEDEHSYFFQALGVEADFQEDIEKLDNLAAPGQVENAATANVGCNLQGEGILEGKKNRSKCGRALPRDGDSEN